MIVDLGKYIGKPYLCEAPKREYFTCYDLAQAIAADRGFILPDQNSPEGVTLRLRIFQMKRSKFLEPIKDPESWSIVIFDLKAFGLHIATIIDEPGKFIHVAEFTRTVRIDRLSNFLYGNPYGYYRTICSSSHSRTAAAP